MINGVERELGIIYPTAKARLDALLKALDLQPLDAKPEKNGNEKSTERRRRILEQLEAGEISAEEAKQKLGVLN